MGDTAFNAACEFLTASPSARGRGGVLEPPARSRFEPLWLRAKPHRWAMAARRPGGGDPVFLRRRHRDCASFRADGGRLLSLGQVQLRISIRSCTGCYGPGPKGDAAFTVAGATKGAGCCHGIRANDARCRAPDWAWNTYCAPPIARSESAVRTDSQCVPGLGAVGAHALRRGRLG
jgi:hypothetical protein